MKKIIKEVIEVIKNTINKEEFITKHKTNEKDFTRKRKLGIMWKESHHLHSNMVKFKLIFRLFLFSEKEDLHSNMVKFTILECKCPNFCRLYAIRRI